MTARNWMQIAALASALGVTGAAIANDTGGTTSTDDGVSGYGMDAPSSGAIVTPEDKASGLGKNDNGHARDRNGVTDEDITPSNDNTTNDDELSVNPGPSHDDDSSVNPGPSNDDASSVNPGSAPPRTGSDVYPGDMGPADMRGE